MFLTVWDRETGIIFLVNQHKPLKYRHDEKEVKVENSGSVVLSIPRYHEKETWGIKNNRTQNQHRCP